MMTAMDIKSQQDSEPGTELEIRLSIQLAHGVTRSMMQLGCTCLSEFTLRNSRRVDVIALDRKGLFTIIEIKTSVADFRANQK
jgi:hypothetical protein